MSDIVLRAVTKTYPRKGKEPVRAVDNLDLTIPDGGIFGLLGPNGAGKTTIIKMICGLILPDSGEVRIGDIDVNRQRRRAMGRIGVVLEGTRNIYWRLSPWENLMYFARLKGIPGRHVADRAERLLSELDLWDRRKEKVRTFSRGMQQKVAIACALIGDPDIILLDEPTLGPDVQASRIVQEWVSQLGREQGKTVILTTHQLPVAQQLCTRIAIIREGRVIANEPTAKLLKRFEDDYYKIRLQGTLPEALAAQLGSFTAHFEDGQTILTGHLRDGLELYPLLEKYHAAGLPLISVSRNEEDLEDIFIRLVETQP